MMRRVLGLGHVLFFYTSADFRARVFFSSNKVSDFREALGPLALRVGPWSLGP